MRYLDYTEHDAGRVRGQRSWRSGRVLQDLIAWQLEVFTQQVSAYLPLKLTFQSKRTT